MAPISSHNPRQSEALYPHNPPSRHSLIFSYFAERIHLRREGQYETLMRRAHALAPSCPLRKATKEEQTGVNKCAPLDSQSKVLASRQRVPWDLLASHAPLRRLFPSFGGSTNSDLRRLIHTNLIFLTPRLPAPLSNQTEFSAVAGAAHGAAPRGGPDCA